MRKILYLTGCEFIDTYRTQLETKYLSKFFDVKSVGVITRSKNLYFKKSKNLDIVTIENKLDYSYFFYFLFTLLFKLILKNKLLFLMKYLFVTFIFLVLECFYLIIYPIYVAIKIKKNFLTNQFLQFFSIFFFIRITPPNKQNTYAKPNILTKWFCWLPENKKDNKNIINEYEEVSIFTFFNFIRIKLRRNFLLLIYCLKTQINFQIISVKDFDGLLCASIFKNLNNCKFIYNSYEFFPFECPGATKFQENILKTLEKIFINSADQIICVSRPMAKLYGDYYKQKKTIIIPNVDFVKKIPKIEKTTKTINFIYQGGLGSYRGVIFLIKNWPKNQNYELTIRSFHNLYFKRLKEYCLRKKVKNIKFIEIKKLRETIDESIKFLINFDVGIISYSNKSNIFDICSARKLSHYVQSELPILTSNIKDSKNIVEKYKIGETYKIDNVIDFQNSLRKFNVKKLVSYKKKVIDFKFRHYNFNNFSKIYKKVYDKK